MSDAPFVLSNVPHGLFHFIFTVPPIALLFLILPTGRGAIPQKAWHGLCLVCSASFTLTLPWENTLVQKGLWTFAPDKHIGFLGAIPYEQFVFYILHPLIVCLFFVYFRYGDSVPLVRQGSVPTGQAIYCRFCACTFAIALFALSLYELKYSLLQEFLPPLSTSDASASGSDPRSLFYLCFIVSWLAPVLCFLFILGADTIMQCKNLIISCVALPTLYFCLINSFALRSGIRAIDKRFTLGYNFFYVMPIEDAFFFLATNFLYACAMILFTNWPETQFVKSGKKRN